MREEAEEEEVLLPVRRILYVQHILTPRTREPHSLLCPSLMCPPSLKPPPEINPPYTISSLNYPHSLDMKPLPQSYTTPTSSHLINHNNQNRANRIAPCRHYQPSFQFNYFSVLLANVDSCFRVLGIKGRSIDTDHLFVI